MKGHQLESRVRATAKGDLDEPEEDSITDHEKVMAHNHWSKSRSVDKATATWFRSWALE